MKLGIGGRISTVEILRHFNPMTAEKFAEVAYAADLMPSIFDDQEAAKNAANIAGVIRQNNFVSKPHFGHLIDMFLARFESYGPITFE